MTTDESIHRIRLSTAPLAMAFLFAVTFSAFADDLSVGSEKRDTKPADTAAAVPRQQDVDKSGSEYVEELAEFIPRPGKHVIKVKQGWSGYLVYARGVHGIEWTIVATQHVGATNDKIANTNELGQIFPSTDPVLKAVALDDDFCKFVAVRKGTATIRYHGQGEAGGSRCDLQIEVEADTTEIDAALKAAIPQSQIKVTEIRSAALLTGTVPTDGDRLQADRVAQLFYPDVISQLKVADAPATPPVPSAEPKRDPSPKAAPQKSKANVRAELKTLRDEVQALRQDIRELNQLLAKRTEPEGLAPFEPSTKAAPAKIKVLREGLLSFHASWCGPCQQMKPTIEKFKKGGHSIQSIDVDAHPELCKEFNVESIPCFVLVKEGREFDRVTGMMSEPEFKKLLGRFEDEIPGNLVPLSVIQLPRVLGLNVGEATVLSFDQPVSILTSKADIVVIERGSPKSARIRGKTTGEVELQLVYRDTGNSERILIRVVDDHLAKALSKTIDLNINDQPLTEVLRQIQCLVDANLHLDTKALEEEGVSLDTKHSIVVTGVSARTALKLILKPLHLDFIEDHEVIRVTSRTRANGELYTVVYNVKDFVEPEAGGKPTTTGPQLVESLQQVGDHDCWDAAGGAGTVRYMQETRSLVVRQTYSMHYRIADFLADRRRPQKKEIFRGQSNDSQASRFIEQRLGVVLAPLTREEASTLPPMPDGFGPTGGAINWRGGLRVAELKQSHLLKENDLIVEINGTDVTRLDEVAIALDRFDKSSRSYDSFATTKTNKYRPQPQTAMKIRVIRDGQLQRLDFTPLTSKQVSDPAKFAVVLYSVADLVIPAPTGPEPVKPDWFRLIDLIMEEVEPNCWISNGGNCSIVTHEKALSLVIRAPQVIHDQVNTLLDRERRKLGVQACFEFRMIAAPDQPIADLTGLSLEIDPGAKCSLLNAAQSKKVMEAFQASGAEMLFAPKVTVFNGQTAYLRNHTWSMKDGTSIDVEIQARGLVAPDRRSVGVNLALNADANKVVEELTRRTINVADGSSLLLDVTEELRAKNPGKKISGRAYMLVEPKVIVLEEEEKRLGSTNPWRKAIQDPDPHDWERMPPPEFIDVDTYLTQARTGRLLFGVGVNSNSGLIGNVDLRKTPRGIIEEEEELAFPLSR